MSSTAVSFGRDGIADWMDDDDEEPPRRVLTATEFMQALALRPDIFVVDSQRHPFVMELACVISAASLGILLSRFDPPMVVGPDFPGLPPLGSASSMPNVTVRTDPIASPSRPAPTSVNRPQTSGRRSMRPGSAAARRASRGSGGGDIKSRVSRRGVLGITAEQVTGKPTDGDPSGAGGYARQIDALLDGTKGLSKGGSGVGRRGAAGIGYGYGPGSGFDGTDGGVDGMIDDLLSASSPPLELTRRHATLSWEAVKPPEGDGFLLGGRNKSSIWRTVQQFMAGLRFAYNKRLREMPGLAGKITVRFAIDEFGNVISCIVMETQIGDDVFQNQVVSTIKRWKFDKIDRPGDITEVMYPFVFSM